MSGRGVDGIDIEGKPTPIHVNTTRGQYERGLC